MGIATASEAQMRYVLCFALLLAGCASRAEREARVAAADHRACTERAFQPGTDAYRLCRLQFEQARAMRRDIIVYAD
jgi:hypothetical protein